MMAMTFKTTPDFDAGVRGLISKCRLNSRVVLKKETGELLKTLIHITPPKDVSASRKKLATRIRGAFAALGPDNRLHREAPTSGVTWYRWDTRYLYGVAPAQDLRNASVESLRHVFYSTRVSPNSGAGYRILPFRHRRKRQKVKLQAKHLVRQATLGKLVTRLTNHFGRLKAGWAGFNGRTWQILSPSGGQLRPPQWVTKHFARARGYCVDNLARTDRPGILIANYAVGVGSPKNRLNWLVRSAMALRAKAMAANVALMVKGRKRLASYAGGKV